MSYSWPGKGEERGHLSGRSPVGGGGGCTRTEKGKNSPVGRTGEAPQKQHPDLLLSWLSHGIHRGNTHPCASEKLSKHLRRELGVKLG